jgi:hypothetical protein
MSEKVWRFSYIIPIPFFRPVGRRRECFERIVESAYMIHGDKGSRFEMAEAKTYEQWLEEAQKDGNALEHAGSAQDGGNLPLH